MQEISKDNLSATTATTNPASCPNCGRPTAASRPQCLYCGAMLREGEGNVEVPSVLPPADLAQATYTLFATSDGDAAKAATILSLDEESVAKLLANPNLPIARVSSAAEADAMAAKLLAADVHSRVVSDESLVPRAQNVRVAKVEIAATDLVLTDFNTRQSSTIARSEIALVVEGLITTSRTDSVSKGRRPANAKSVRESVVGTDEPVLDIYTSSTQRGFRIVPSGFDFSVLGEQKRLTAAENWRALIELLASECPNAVVDREYKNVRRLLDLVWPADASSSSGGKVNSGFGRRDFSSTSSSSNLTQFNLYSRSRRLFYERT